MTDRERLIDILANSGCTADFETFESLADHLIANGVVIPVRCKDCAYVSPMKFFCNRYKYAILENGYCNKGKLKECEDK